MTVRMNSRMRKLIDRLDTVSNKQISLNISDIKDLLVPNYIEVEGCILLSSAKKVEQEGIDINKIIEIYGDRAGFEWSENEVVLNYFIDYDKNDELVPLFFGLQLLDIWESKLKYDFPEYNFTLTLGYNNGDVTLRFYRSRNEEKDVLSNDLELFIYEGILVKYI